MEILRERELRESIEKQMMEDQRSRGKLFHHQPFDIFLGSFRHIFEYQNSSHKGLVYIGGGERDRCSIIYSCVCSID
jgi:hypothetical protein